jgi:hypothetical protein
MLMINSEPRAVIDIPLAITIDSYIRTGIAVNFSTRFTWSASGRLAAPWAPEHPT